MEGWVSIHRQLQEHWIWKSKEPFDKRSAWIDLIMLVNHKKERIKFDSGFIEVERGQKITSIRFLANRWKWSRTKVNKFLDDLEMDKMIVHIKDTKKTFINIENYDKFQKEDFKKCHQKDIRKSHRSATKRHKQ